VFSVAVNITGKAPGTYPASITVLDNVTGNFKTIDVTLTINPVDRLDIQITGTGCSQVGKNFQRTITGTASGPVNARLAFSPDGVGGCFAWQSTNDASRDLCIRTTTQPSQTNWTFFPYGDGTFEFFVNDGLFGHTSKSVTASVTCR
jgi:hypothetical protein